MTTGQKNHYQRMFDDFNRRLRDVNELDVIDTLESDETREPYVAPNPYRGKRRSEYGFNDPVNYAQLNSLKD